MRIARAVSFAAAEVDQTVQLSAWVGVGAVSHVHQRDAVAGACGCHCGCWRWQERGGTTRC